MPKSSEVINYRTVKEVLHRPADARIGKSGLSPGFIENIKQLIKHHKIIKVKILQYISKEEVIEIANLLSQKTDSNLVLTRGRTFILEKKNV